MEFSCIWVLLHLKGCRYNIFLLYNNISWTKSFVLLTLKKLHELCRNMTYWYIIALKSLSIDILKLKISDPIIYLEAEKSRPISYFWKLKNSQPNSYIWILKKLTQFIYLKAEKADPFHIFKIWKSWPISYIWNLKKATQFIYLKSEKADPFHIF